MKRFLKLGSLMAVVAALTISVLGGQTSAIVNGTNATQQYGAVSIWAFDNQGVFRHRCTAALISQMWAVTAGHCDFLLPDVLIPGQTSVRVGSPNNASGYQEVGLAQVIVHPDYYQPPDPTPEDPSDDLPNVNDIALIKFQHPVTNAPKKQLALPLNSPSIGTTGKVAGWGWICDDQVPPAGPPNCGLPFTNTLQETTLKVVTDSRCEYFSDQATQICTVGANGKHTMACRADSGAPFVRSILQQKVLMGVVSGDGDQIIFHPNECDSNVNGDQGTGRFTDVSKYTHWIIDTIYDNLRADTKNKPLTLSEKAANIPKTIKN